MKRIRFQSTLCACTLMFLIVTLAFSSASADTTVGGTISTDTTWTLAGSPYVVTANITVQGVDGPDDITTLTIEPGVQVRFNRYRLMNIGGNTGNPGALVAQGTSANPIMFTSNETNKAPGDWYGVRIFNTADDTSTLMAHCVVEYSGYGSNGAVYIYNAAPSIQNCEFRNASNSR
ncbi:MAG: hypothetical protein HKP58_02310 [Desulfatitalea sp.]|nr:hypothetical protein [Desulfatitalea sp.]NNJ99222.1 hypothetical protein [Desulfatitalea sp.]